MKNENEDEKNGGREKEKEEEEEEEERGGGGISEKGTPKKYQLWLPRKQKKKTRESAAGTSVSACA